MHSTNTVYCPDLNGITDRIVLAVSLNVKGKNYSFQCLSEKLTALTEEAIDDIYNYYGSDMEITRDEFRAVVTRWRHKWNGSNQHMKAQTLVETLDQANPQFYVALVTLLTYPVSTCTAERSFISSVKRLKTPLRSTMTDERLNSLAILHIHKHKDVAIDSVVTEFTHLKGRRLALCL